MFGKEKEEAMENGDAVVSNEVNKKSEASKKTNEKRKAMIAAVVNYVGTLKDVPAEVQAASDWLQGKNRVAFGGGGGGQSTLRKMFPNVGDKLTSLECFEKFDMSSKDMAKHIKNGVEKGIWVSLKENTYTLVAVGDQPADWKGPFPKTQA